MSGFFFLDAGQQLSEAFQLQLLSYIQRACKSCHHSFSKRHFCFLCKPQHAHPIDEHKMWQPHPGVSLSFVFLENSSHISHWLSGWVSKEVATLHLFDKPWQDGSHTDPKCTMYRYHEHAYMHFLHYAQCTLWKYLMVKYDIFLQSNSTELTGNEHITLYWAWGRAVGKRRDWVGEVGRTRGAGSDDVISESLFMVQRQRLLAKWGNGRGGAATRLGNNNKQAPEVTECIIQYIKCTKNTCWI